MNIEIIYGKIIYNYALDLRNIKYDIETLEKNIKHINIKNMRKYTSFNS